MTADKFNSATPNNEVGLFFTRSRRVVINQSFGELATVIKCSSAGYVVWQNSQLGEVGVWYLESGEIAPIACDKILTSATIDGNIETTTATGLFWATSAAKIGKDSSGG